MQQLDKKHDAEMAAGAKGPTEYECQQMHPHATIVCRRRFLSARALGSHQGSYHRARHESDEEPDLDEIIAKAVREGDIDLDDERFVLQIVTDRPVPAGNLARIERRMASTTR